MLSRLERNRISVRKYAAANRERLRVKAAEYRRDNPDKVRAATNKWFADNPGYRTKKALEWRKANPERARALSRKWIRANRSQVKASAAVRYLNNARASRIRAKLYRATHPDKRKRINKKHRLTRTDKLKIMEKAK